MTATGFSLPASTAEEALAAAASGTARLLDVRKPPAARASGLRVAGSLIRDPFAFGHNDPLMASTTPVIAFCVHGHEVSRFACALMLLHGVPATYVTGGFEALAAAGAELEPAGEEG